MNSAISIETLGAVTAKDAAALARLLAQLSASATFDVDRIHEITKHDATDLLVARSGGQIVGMATLVTFPCPSGRRGHVEDVVVDDEMRGRGIARQLLHAMTRLADTRGLRTLDLTSRPSRKSAPRLYESAGFTRRETTVLRYTP